MSYLSIVAIEVQIKSSIRIMRHTLYVNVYFYSLLTEFDDAGDDYDEEGFNDDDEEENDVNIDDGLLDEVFE